MAEARPAPFPPYIEDQTAEKFWVTWINGVAEFGPRIRNIKIQSVAAEHHSRRCVGEGSSKQSIATRPCGSCRDLVSEDQPASKCGSRALAGRRRSKTNETCLLLWVRLGPDLPVVPPIARVEPVPLR
jgi:hypothetical protein